ncbi:MarR family transcriptional regulator [Paenibacillus helianthi]|uniref:MarR family transcriptional regulator n=2 Tax=Paenibacillus TaxID=44249 RepID=A0ABX3ES31_9BACL|nr:MarR family transcriptional regulator [Paenibacillus helianthi]OKP87512.1 MarR family transcriptional regulator [Paenibacillus helianthi]OKP89183.1 MarR family transcriptional regulator [Paenibacillus sp. P32E]OKP92564.1 MarR family transcriptional regulator [Paenibacillus sp. P3E]
MMDHSIDVIELEMAILVRRLVSMTTYRKIGNLDRSAYLLLHQIASHGSAGVKALSDEFHLDISTVSRQAAALEQKGYVKRIPDPVDGRAYSLEMTDMGEEVLNENKQARQESIGKMLSAWSDGERVIFGELLRKFNAAIHEEIPE